MFNPSAISKEICEVIHIYKKIALVIQFADPPDFCRDPFLGRDPEFAERCSTLLGGPVITLHCKVKFEYIQNEQ